MHLHGSRLIILEFGLAAVLETGLFVLSVNYGLRIVDWPWWSWLWLIICAGLILNSLTIWWLARQIAQRDGNRPARPGIPAAGRALMLFSLLTVIPLVLPLLAWRRRCQKGGQADSRSREKVT